MLHCKSQYPQQVDVEFAPEVAMNAVIKFTDIAGNTHWL